MALIQEKIPHQKIAKELSKWSFSEKDFTILDELKSDTDLEISKNTLVIGDATINGTLTLVAYDQDCFFIVCGALRATNFLTGRMCTAYINSFQITNLFSAAQTNAVTNAYAHSNAKYVASGHSMGKLTMDNGELTADIIDDYVGCENGAKLNFKSKDNLIKTFFPDYISEEDWDNGDEAFHREKGVALGIENIDKLDEDALHEAGANLIYEKRLTISDVQQKILNG